MRQSDRQPAAILLMGPTAAGKTDVAVRLVEALPCEIVSVDSALVYRGMDIGTAKPSAELCARAPHRLIDICDPAEAYSAARFREDALREMAEISAAGRIPLLVGGTMLYFKALQQGLAQLPAADAAVRARLDQQAERDGWAALHARLARIDPRAAQRIHPNDPQRIQRALEVYELTGVPLSEYIDRPAPAAFPYRAVKLAIAPAERAVLHQRIERRFGEMLAQGLIAEVQALRDRGDLQPQLPSMRAVGYRQVWNYLSGEISYEDMARQAVYATRQLAKRQLTWLRAEPDLAWFDALDEEIFDKVLKYLEDASI